MQKKCPNTVLVGVGVREADIYELFALALSDPGGPKLLVRAAHNRKLAEEQVNICDRVSYEEISGHLEVRFPGRVIKRLWIQGCQYALPNSGSSPPTENPNMLH